MQYEGLNEHVHCTRSIKMSRKVLRSNYAINLNNKRSDDA